MDTIADIAAARRCMRLYLAHAEGQLPDDTFTMIEGYVDSPAASPDAIVRTASLLYARRDELDNEGRETAASLARFAAVNAWYGMAENNRGNNIATVLLRDADAGEVTHEDDDPLPADQFVRKPDPAPAAPVAPAF